VIGNWFVLCGREELEALGHERCQFVTIGCNVVENLLNRRPKFRKGRIVVVAGNFSLEELPETFNQVQGCYPYLSWIIPTRLDGAPIGYGG
jgi:hypothetical protein